MYKQDPNDIAKQIPRTLVRSYQVLPPYEDYMLAVAKGQVTGHSIVHKFGQNNDIGTAKETVWDVGGLYSYLTSATALKVSSDDANDTSDGTGARTVQIYGLNSDYDEIDETITLNGQTAVNTTKLYLRIYRMVVKTAGSGDEAAGNIFAGTLACG